MTSLKTVVLCDLSWMYHKFSHALCTLEYTVPATGQVFPIGGMYGVFREVLRLHQWLDSDIVLAIEPKSNSRRKTLDMNYKATRTPKPKEFYDLLTETLSALSTFSFVTIVSSPVPSEADDVLYTLSLKYSDLCNKLYLVSGDNDMLQIAGNPKIKSGQLQLIKSGKIMEDASELCQTKYNISAENILMFRSILGDSSDNIPKVAPRFFSKWAKVFAEQCTVPEDIDKLIAEGAYSGNCLKYAKILSEQKERWKLNIELMELQEVPLELFIPSEQSAFMDCLKKYNMLSLMAEVAPPPTPVQLEAPPGFNL